MHHFRNLGVIGTLSALRFIQHMLDVDRLPPSFFQMRIERGEKAFEKWFHPRIIRRKHLLARLTICKLVCQNLERGVVAFRSIQQG